MLLSAKRGRFAILDMKVLLRNRRTKLFYVGRNRSCLKHDQALDFSNIPQAAEFTLQERLLDMEIVLRYEACDGEVTLPVLADWRSFEKGVLRPGLRIAGA